MLGSGERAVNDDPVPLDDLVVQRDNHVVAAGYPQFDVGGQVRLRILDDVARIEAAVGARRRVDQQVECGLGRIRRVARVPKAIIRDDRVDAGVGLRRRQHERLSALKGDVDPFQVREIAELERRKRIEVGHDWKRLAGAVTAVGQVLHDRKVVGNANGNRTIDVLGAAQRRRGHVRVLDVGHIDRRVSLIVVGRPIDQEREGEVGRQHRRTSLFAGGNAGTAD